MVLFNNALPAWQLNELKKEIREAGKSDLQRERELKDILVNNLECQIHECKANVRIMNQLIYDIFRYLQDHNYKVPVMLDEPTVKTYTNEKLATLHVAMRTWQMPSLTNYQRRQYIVPI